MVRLSNENDKQALKELLGVCFGCIHDKNALNHKYYVYEEKGKIVAMSGLVYDCHDLTLWVNWTCTHPSYRHKGYMHAIFTEMLKDVDEDVQCSCWRLPYKDKINLYNVITSFGFVEDVLSNRTHEAQNRTCKCPERDCVCYRGEFCKCYEDLWIRHP